MEKLIPREGEEEDVSLPSHLDRLPPFVLLLLAAVIPLGYFALIFWVKRVL